MTEQPDAGEAIAGMVSAQLTTRKYMNLPLLPLLDDSTQNHLHYVLPPEFGQPFNHLRFRNETVENSSTYTAPARDNAVFTLPGTFLYGGVIFPAFGTFIAESIHRLWPVFTDPACRDIPIVFHSTGPGLSGEMALPRFVEQIFALLGIDASRLILVDRPMAVERLIVANQGSMLGFGSTGDAYDEVFPPRRAEVAAPGQRSGHIYVSRSKYLHSGSYLGETLVEQVLRDSGQFEILHPQDHSPAEAAAKLEACESAVFAEGSALHILELCRAPPPKVFVILRRDLAVWRRFFELMVAKRCANVHLHQVRDRLVSLNWSTKHEAAMDYKASAVHDIAALLEAVSAFSGLALRVPTEQEIRTAQALSLLNLIMDQRATPATTPLDVIGSAIRVLQWQAAKLDILPFDLPAVTPGMIVKHATAATARKGPRHKRPSGGQEGGPQPRRLRPAPS